MKKIIFFLVLICSAYVSIAQANNKKVRDSNTIVETKRSSVAVSRPKVKSTYLKSTPRRYDPKTGEPIYTRLEIDAMKKAIENDKVIQEYYQRFPDKKPKIKVVGKARRYPKDQSGEGTWPHR